jgi:putative DNA primase/helicase
MSESESEILDKLARELQLNKWWHDLIGEQSAASTTNLDPQKAAEGLPRTEVSAAAEIARKFKNRLSYTERGQRWYLWDGRIHTPCEGSIVALQIAKLYYQAMCDALEFIQNAIYEQADIMRSSGVQDAEQKAKAIRDLYDKTAFVKHRDFRDRLATDAGMSALMRVLKTEVVVASDYYDNDQNFFVVRDKVVDLAYLRSLGKDPVDWDRLFLEHSPERPVTKYFDADYRPTVNLGHWDGFLSRSIPDADARNYLQIVAGAAFMGNSALRCIINLFGPPGSGKSMFINTMHKLGKSGAGYSAMPDSKAIVKVSGQNFEQDEFRGRRFVGISEPPSSEKIDSDFLKKVTGDEWVETRTLNVKSSGWVPQCVIFVASNKALRINTRDKATVDRVHVIEFPIEFEQEIEGINHVPEERRMIEGLGDLLLEDRSQILTWILVGMVKFVRDGQKLRPPASVKQKAGQNVTEASSALRFVEELVEEGQLRVDYSEKPEFFVGEKELYTLYSAWCTFSGERSMSRKNFSTDISGWYNPQSEKCVVDGSRRFFGVAATNKFLEVNGTVPFPNAK